MCDGITRSPLQVVNVTYIYIIDTLQDRDVRWYHQVPAASSKCNICSGDLVIPSHITILQCIYDIYMLHLLLAAGTW